MKTLLIKNGGTSFCDECSCPLGEYKENMVELSFDITSVELCPDCANHLVEKLLRLKNKCGF